MANVRCPMCSTINPSEVEVCSNCGARLKPVRPQTGGPTNEESDWLSGLRSGGGSEPDEGKSRASKPLDPQQDRIEPTESEDMPDWLSRIRDRARDESPIQPESPEPEGEDPDWMKDLRGGAQGPMSDSDTPSEPAGAMEPVDDWLDRLPGGPPQEDPSAEPAEEELQLDDWLQQYPGPENASGTPGNEEWISKLAAWQSGIDDTGSLEPSATSDQSVEPPAGDETEALGGFGLTGFLSGLQEDQTPDDPAQDWSDQKPQESQVESQENSIPDWLLEEESPLASNEQAGENSEPALPAWMTGADFGSVEESQPDQTAASGQGFIGDDKPDVPEQEGSLPDWFNTFDESQETPEEVSHDVESEVSSIPTGDLPDWLRSDGEISFEPSPPASVEDYSIEPDWQAGLPQVFDEEPEIRMDAPVEPERFVSPDPILPSSSEPVYEETPEWLKDFSSQAPEESIPASALQGLDDFSLPDMVNEGDQVLTGGELPDWLSENDAASDVGGEPAQTAEPAGEELARADLPEWVKEMRPIESVIPGVQAPAEANQQVEKAGPLAGLRGVLPAEDLAARYRKPPVYSAKLRVTEKQRSQAALFESILTQETQPLLIAPQRSQAPRVLGRIVVALIFLTVLFGLRMFPLGLAPAPMLTPPELRDMFNQIDQAGQTQAPVLLAVDYEPGRAGEMFFASTPIIEHLMAKNARIVVLSTVPAGPALAERLLSDSARLYQEQSQQSFDLNTQVLNLGYLPGGTISLLEFAQIPSRAAPATLSGDYEVWQNSYLRDVTGMSGFSQVIVLTDSAETGRAWVEQVQPMMGGTPLYMITSVQAAPMLLPYVQSKQINGLVNGLLGGVIYGQWRQVDTSASAYWELYQAGMLLAFVILLIGGLVSAGTAVIKRKNKDEA